VVDHYLVKTNLTNAIRKKRGLVATRDASVPPNWDCISDIGQPTSSTTTSSTVAMLRAALIVWVEGGNIKRIALSTDPSVSYDTTKPIPMSKIWTIVT